MDEIESKLLRVADKAERYSEKGHYTQAIDRHTRAAKYFQTGIGLTSDHASHHALQLLVSVHTLAIERIRKQLYGPAHSAHGSTVSAAASTASVTSPQPPPQAQPLAGSTLAIASPTPVATAAPIHPFSFLTTTVPATTTAAVTSNLTPTATATPTAMSHHILRRALDALALSASNDQHAAESDETRAAEQLRTLTTELRNKLSADEDALSRTLTAASTATTTATAAAAAASDDVRSLKAALSAARSQLVQSQLAERSAVWENESLKQRLAARNHHSKEAQRMLAAVLSDSTLDTTAGVSPGTGTGTGTGSLLCSNEVCALEKKKLKDRLASANAQLASEISLRQKQSKLLDTYQSKLKRYDEKWEQLKLHATAKRASISGASGGGGGGGGGGGSGSTTSSVSSLPGATAVTPTVPQSK